MRRLNAQLDFRQGLKALLFSIADSSAIRNFRCCYIIKGSFTEYKKGSYPPSSTQKGISSRKQLSPEENEPSVPVYPSHQHPHAHHHKNNHISFLTSLIPSLSKLRTIKRTNPSLHLPWPSTPFHPISAHKRGLQLLEQVPTDTVHYLPINLETTTFNI